MKNTKKLTHDIKLWFAISLQVFLFPISIATPFIRAQEATTEPYAVTTSDPVTSTAPTVEEPAPTVEQPVSQGSTEPASPEDTSYTFNSTTGLWENQYYTWNPVTKLTSPKTEQTYSYNPDSGMWDNTDYTYAPDSGTYVPRTVDDTTTNENPISEQQSLAEPALKLSNTNVLDPNYNLGHSSLEVTSENNGYFNNFFNANISVSVTSNARSGDASVFQNTIGGSALSGNASTEANIMNLIQSAWGVGDLLPQIYTENIQGDYFGDIFLDPSILTVNNSTRTNELVVNSTQDVSITNDIELVSQSGDALVAGNTQAGDATSGSATAILNLMNIINTSISTGQSFVGMLNIYGDLEGDVLMPDNMIDTLLASNIPTSQINVGENINTSFLLNNNNSHSIDNNIQATASSGDAEVGRNTNAGNATSGSADTNITVFNLTGNHVVAEQALLVFVNVQGTWVGFITNAPAGSNSALLGGNVTSSTQDDYSENSTYDINNSSSITNNVDLTATTGSASVVNNTSAGDATTGDAKVAANIANISNSTFSLANWFGMLFINIFGNWSGSFGTNTAFGNIIDNTVHPIPTTSSENSNSVNTTSSSPMPQGVRVFAVTMGSSSSGGTSITSATPVMEEDVPPPTVSNSDQDNNKVAVLGESISNPPSSANFNPIIWGSIIIGISAFIFYRRRLSAV